MLEKTGEGDLEEHPAYPIKTDLRFTGAPLIITRA